jgi:hypothetical protein
VRRPKTWSGLGSVRVARGRSRRSPWAYPCLLVRPEALVCPDCRRSAVRPSSVWRNSGKHARSLVAGQLGGEQWLKSDDCGLWRAARPRMQLLSKGFSRRGCQVLRPMGWQLPKPVVAGALGLPWQQLPSAWQRPSLYGKPAGRRGACRERQQTRRAIRRRHRAFQSPDHGQRLRSGTSLPASGARGEQRERPRAMRADSKPRAHRP